MAIAAPLGDKQEWEEDDLYPSGDGKPMAETRLHREVMAYCCDALELFVSERPDVWVSGNDFIYYEEGNPKARVSPDCYVVFGVPRRRRSSYFVWCEDGKTPAFVLEVTSKSTRREDIHKKRPLYENVLRVPEYFQFDPTGDYLRPHLQGFRLMEDRYTPLLPVENRLHSEQLGLDLVAEGQNLRFYDPVKQVWLLSYAQEHAARMAEAQARAAVEAENQRLRAELEALRQRRQSRNNGDRTDS